MLRFWRVLSCSENLSACAETTLSQEAQETIPPPRSGLRPRVHTQAGDAASLLDMSSNMLFLGFCKQGLGPSAGVWKPSGRMELNNHGNYGSCNIAGKVRQETPESNSRFSTRTATGTLSISNSTGCNE